MFSAMLEQIGCNSKQLEIRCGILLSWSCSPPTTSTRIFIPICSFFFHVAESGWQEAGWSSVRLHAIYDLACWTQSGPNLQMIWFSVCVWVCVCVCVCVCARACTLKECAGWCQAMLCELTTPYWGWVLRCLTRGLFERQICCSVWFPPQWIRDSDSVVNYESNHWPSYFLREGVCWLNEPWQAAFLPFYCLIWVNQAGQRKIAFIYNYIIMHSGGVYFNRKCSNVKEGKRWVGKERDEGTMTHNEWYYRESVRKLQTARLNRTDVTKPWKSNWKGAVSHSEYK